LAEQALLMTMMQQQMPRPDRRGSNAAERIRDEDYTLPIEKMRAHNSKTSLSVFHRIFLSLFFGVGGGFSRGRVYPAKQRVFEALAPGEVAGHPAPTGLAASACCSGIVTATVTTTTPNNANAETIAITANVVFISISLKISSY
jgi:hypothetical protein